MLSVLIEFELKKEAFDNYDYQLTGQHEIELHSAHLLRCLQWMHKNAQLQLYQEFNDNHHFYMRTEHENGLEFGIASLPLSADADTNNRWLMNGTVIYSLTAPVKYIQRLLKIMRLMNC